MREIALTADRHQSEARLGSLDRSDSDNRSGNVDAVSHACNLAHAWRTRRCEPCFRVVRAAGLVRE